MSIEDHAWVVITVPLEMVLVNLNTTGDDCLLWTHLKPKSRGSLIFTKIVLLVLQSESLPLLFPEMSDPHHPIANSPDTFLPSPFLQSTLKMGLLQQTAILSDATMEEQYIFHSY